MPTQPRARKKFLAGLCGIRQRRHCQVTPWSTRSCAEGVRPARPGGLPLEGPPGPEGVGQSGLLSRERSGLAGVGVGGQFLWGADIPEVEDTASRTRNVDHRAR
jgi:hypothetical protein